MKKNILCTIGATLVFGCGGGGGSTSQVSFTASPIKVFSDGAGVGSINYVADGQSATGYVITPELSAALAEVIKTGEINDVNTDGISIIGTGPNTVIREGAVTTEGVTFNVTVITTTEDDVIISILEEPNSGIAMFTTEGPAATNIPNSGLATYTGTLGLKQRYNPSSFELGTFNAEVNFDPQNPTVSFNGATASYSATGLATVSNNSFSSSAMVIGTPSGDVSGSLRGDLHDGGAADMAGVIYSNGNSGTYVGSFVGSK
jgi:hypothetical protein